MSARHRRQDQLAIPAGAEVAHSSIENPNQSEGQAYSKVRLQLLATQIHDLGAYPLFHLLAEIVEGAPPIPRIERYARLSREHGHFIRALGGDQFPDRLFVISGN